MSIHVLLQKYSELIEGKITSEDVARVDRPLSEYVSEAMTRGGKKLSTTLKSDKTIFYYAIAGTIASMILEDDATEEDVYLISLITPAMVNLVIGIADELGLNENAQYTIVLGKEKQ